MNKTIINVPKGINFLSEWKEFNLPEHPHILNKQLTGCGFTQWALTCPMNVILCSPRRILLENKEDQYLEELNKGIDFPYKIYYAKNEYEKILDIGKDINSPDKNYEILTDESPVDYVLSYKQKLKDFIFKCQFTNKFCKILVTYDSFRKVKEMLKELNLFDKFYVIVDEFQSIFVDAKFKSSTELELVKLLQDITKLGFVSATPMIEEYLNMMDEFKNLPYYELDWETEDPNRITKPKINPIPCFRLTSKVSEIIEKYRAGEWRDSDNAIIRYRDSNEIIQEIRSREAVFYINSVKNICDIIKHCKLKQEECNIIVANTLANKEQIRKAFKVTKKEFQGLGKVPLKNEINKMFTFCTRTVYLGADFWSDNARSFVFSDANIDCLAVDITLDLPQILGRQRNENNPWKNELNIYFKPIGKNNKVPKEEFDEYLNKKKKDTEDTLNILQRISINDPGRNKVMGDYEILANVYKYRNDYISIDKHEGKLPVPKFNRLVMISEMRSFEIQQLDYADRCSVRNTINISLNQVDNELITKFLDVYEKYTNFIDKMKLVCELMKDIGIDNIIKDQILTRIDEQVANYIRILGVERIESHSYIRIRLDREVSKLINNQSLDPSELIYSNFQEGNKYSKAYIKEKLKELYASINLKRTAKATDIEEYFLAKPVNYMENGKKTHGFELIKKK